MGAKSKQKIGVMGGTFDPIHYGHLLIAENAYEQFQLDKVIFMPTGHSPHKNEKQVLGAKERIDMIKLAIKDNPHFSCSNYEVLKEDVSYTYLTLQEIHQQCPDYELYFIMGADSLAYFSSWQNPEKISDLSTILVAVRDGLNTEKLYQIRESLHQKYGTQISFINTPNFSVSSHMIRERIVSRHTVRYLVPDTVEQYLMQHHIYLDGQ